MNTPEREQVRPRGPRAWAGLPVSLLAILTLMGLLEPVGLRAGDWLVPEGPVPRLSIEVAPRDMAILRAYHWEWGGNESERTNVFVTVREGGRVYTNVAVHLKGSAGSFRPVDDLPAMTLHFGKGGSPQRFHGLEKIHLNNSVQDPSRICEILGRELFNAAGVPTPRASHAVVTLNGRRLGVYVLVEGCDRKFLGREFPGPKGRLYDAGFARDIDRELLVSIGDAGREQSAIRGLATASADKDLAHRLERLTPLLDVDRFVTMAAMEVLLAHWDGYCIGHNNYRVFEPGEGGRLIFIPHGLDQLFGVYRATPEYTITPGFKSIVSKGVMEARGGRARYMERLGVLYTNFFIGGRLSARVEEVARRLRPEFQEDPEDRAQFEGAVTRLQDRVRRRVTSIAEQLIHPRPPLAFGPGGIAPVTGWGFHPDSSGRALGVRETDENRPVLGIRGGGATARTWASWRTSVLLEAGEYELRGRCRMEAAGAALEGTGPVSVAIRLSGERGGYPKVTAREWLDVHHAFTLGDTTEVELICELRGGEGTGWFDLGSLRLARKPSEGPRAPAPGP